MIAAHWRRSACCCRAVSRATPQPIVDEAGEGEIDIVAAEQQVLADGDALECRAGLVDGDRHEREVGGAAPDVADQHAIPVAEEGGQVGVMRPDPCVERRRRLLDHGQVLETGDPGGLDRQLARLLAERRGNGERDRLPLEAQWRAAAPRGERVVPRVAHVGQIGGRRLDR